MSNQSLLRSQIKTISKIDFFNKPTATVRQKPKTNPEEGLLEINELDELVKEIRNRVFSKKLLFKTGVVYLKKLLSKNANLKETKLYQDIEAILKNHKNEQLFKAGIEGICLKINAKTYTNKKEGNVQGKATIDQQKELSSLQKNIIDKKIVESKFSFIKVAESGKIPEKSKEPYHRKEKAEKGRQANVSQNFFNKSTVPVRQKPKTNPEEGLLEINELDKLVKEIRNRVFSKKLLFKTGAMYLDEMLKKNNIKPDLLKDIKELREFFKTKAKEEEKTKKTQSEQKNFSQPIEIQGTQANQSHIKEKVSKTASTNVSQGLFFKSLKNPKIKTEELLSAQQERSVVAEAELRKKNLAEMAIEAYGKCKDESFLKPNLNLFFLKKKLAQLNSNNSEQNFLSKDIEKLLINTGNPLLFEQNIDTFKENFTSIYEEIIRSKGGNIGYSSVLVKKDISTQKKDVPLFSGKDVNQDNKEVVI